MKSAEFVVLQSSRKTVLLKILKNYIYICAHVEQFIIAANLFFFSILTSIEKSVLKQICKRPFNIFLTSKSMFLIYANFVKLPKWCVTHVVLTLSAVSSDAWDTHSTSRNSHH